MPYRNREMVDRYEVTHLGISPTLIRSLMAKGDSWVEKHSLQSLEVIGSTGEPWNPDPWMWLFETVCKRKVPICNYSGGTEIFDPGSALDTDQKIVDYATRKIEQAHEYAIWRMKRIQTFKNDKETIENS